MKISEIFYSIQGEGSRAGTANVFIRLSGCKAKYACSASGVKCDTEFESGKEMTMEDLFEHIQAIAGTCKNIIWTGGEPTDQLTEEIIATFKQAGFYQAIETSGLNPVPKGIDWITVSPKVAEHILAKNFPDVIDEIKYIRHKGQFIPEPIIKARYRYISPHSDGFNINYDNLAHCIELVKENPTWILTMQYHKTWRVL